MVLSPNDEEVASSKKDTQFKTRVPINHTLFHTKAAKKNIPFGAALTFIAYIREYPSGAKNALQIISLAAYASETNNKGLKLRTFYCLLFNGRNRMRKINSFSHYSGFTIHHVVKTENINNNKESYTCLSRF